ncbi:helix-turn-helix domain-containing protein [Streptococcus pseudoporcinus]|uniref:helix-turn-helix domain-containing protein n=1 Tax=Streptococcus pseudoporcinus TaxID=361101 RepID=UPI000563BA35|nr:helix-turn-helix domain-containing protein [Streptococcus pseudoporcinus]VEF93858.1 membrane protein [Streptococcus pseudoporcinus]
MRNQTLGEFLRESRVNRKVTLDEIEDKTGISSHYLLAMELDQFKIIPEDKIDSFFSQYAKMVSLDFGMIKKMYLDQIANTQYNEEPSITQRVEEKLSQRQEPFVFPLKTEARVSEPDVLASKELDFKEKEPDVEANALVDNTKEKKRDSLLADNHRDRDTSRLSRYQDDHKKSKSIFSIILLTVIALAVFAFVFFAVWQQFSKENNLTLDKAKSILFKKNENKTSSSKTPEVSSQPSSSEKKTVIKTEGQDNYLVADIQKAKDTVEVSVSLAGAESAWIALSHSDIGEAGTTLTQESPTYTTTLPADTKESLLMLGVREGVSVTVDGQKLDLTPMTSNDISYITLKIQ